jgi:maltose alpha-D-glucosyltransferase / alpha-amylase
MAHSISQGALYESLPAVLPEFLMSRRWFGGKARGIASVEVADIVPIRQGSVQAYFLLARVQYRTGATETYGLPLVSAPPPGNAGHAPAPLRLQYNSQEIALTDALLDEGFLKLLLETVAQGLRFSGDRGQIKAVATSALQPLLRAAQGALSPSLMRAEQSNSSIVYGQSLVFKIFRRLEQGLNPDLEIGAFLTERTSFRNAPPVAGFLEYEEARGARTSLGILQGFVINQGDAWKFTLGRLAGYYETRLTPGSPAAQPQDASIVAMSESDSPANVRENIGPYLASAELLGQRTAELHLALASVQSDPAFAPEGFNRASRHAFSASALELVSSTLELLRGQLKNLPPEVRQESERILALEAGVRRRFQHFEEFEMSAARTRIHGDYHLGQVLFTGSDFMIIDFEGEPARSLEERRQKRSPLQDVAGMLRSFHYAAYAPLLGEASASFSPDQLHSLRPWANYWQKWVSAAFLRSYRRTAGDAAFVPRSNGEFALLLDSYLLDKAVYELGYELNNRPGWLRIPLDGILQLVRESE